MNEDTLCHLSPMMRETSEPFIVSFFEMMVCNIWSLQFQLVCVLLLFFCVLLFYLRGPSLRRFVLIVSRSDTGGLSVYFMSVLCVARWRVVGVICRHRSTETYRPLPSVTEDALYRHTDTLCSCKYWYHHIATLTVITWLFCSTSSQPLPSHVHPQRRSSVHTGRLLILAICF